jgi:hypothetical protein
MSSRRWIDTDNLVKMIGGGLVALAAITFVLATEKISRGIFVLGGLGVVCFFWGLLSIGDQKNEWE